MARRPRLAHCESSTDSAPGCPTVSSCEELRHPDCSTLTRSSPRRRGWITRGVVHHFDNTHDVDAKALAVVTPGILGPDYFREVAAVFEAAAGGPPDLAAIAAVMSRHGLTPAP